MVRRLLVSLAAIVAAGAVLASPAAAARIYAGQPAPGTQAQIVLSLSSSGAAITKLTFHLGTSCSEAFHSVDAGTTQSVDAVPDRMRTGAHYLVGGKVKDGRLSGRIVGADRFDATTLEFMNVVLTGTVSKTRASGSMAVKLARTDEATGAVRAQCSRTVRWSALRNPGVVYGGATSQDEPIVVELAKGRRQVSHVHVSWYGPCAGGGAWIDPHDEFDFRPIALSRTGTFSRTYGFDLGLGATQIERITGRVSAAKISGTFQSDVTIAGAAKTTSCSSGRVTWTAATG